jgi:hypothetical protein
VSRDSAEQTLQVYVCGKARTRINWSPRIWVNLTKEPSIRKTTISGESKYGSSISLKSRRNAGESDDAEETPYRKSGSFPRLRLQNLWHRLSRRAREVCQVTGTEDKDNVEQPSYNELRFTGDEKLQDGGGCVRGAGKYLRT